MPWKVEGMSELRLAFVHEVVTLREPMAVACRKYGISRKTGYKWLRRYQQQPSGPLGDRSRRPQRSPGQTTEAMEQEILQVRGRYGWGARKIWAHLRNEDESCGRQRCLPCAKTVGNILRRNGRTQRASQEASTPPQFFERSKPNALWQCDFKGPVEVGRRKVHPFSLLDDHSRFLLALTTCLDVTMQSAWRVLWHAFGEFGLPESMLCDNAFGTQYPAIPSVSWFDSQLIRLGIRPIHGRPYHPQTQGKVERLHATLEREVWPHVCRNTVEAFDAEINRWRVEVYNPLRPHEALGDRPPLSRFEPSVRRRPAEVPEASYPAGSVTRSVSRGGDISWQGYRILVGGGLSGQRVRIEDRSTEVAVFYCEKRIRCLRHEQLDKRRLL